MKPATLFFICTSSLALALPVDVTDRAASDLSKRVLGSNHIAAGWTAAKTKVQSPKTPGAAQAAYHDSLSNAYQKGKPYDDPRAVKHADKFNKHSIGVQKPIPELASQNPAFLAKHAPKPQARAQALPQARP